MATKKPSAGPRFDPAFKPLWTYLEREYGEAAAGNILSYMLFAGASEGRYSYKNKITRALITVDESGAWQAGGRNALQTLASYRRRETNESRKASK
jgi:hypothetical protein